MKKVNYPTRVFFKESIGESDCSIVVSNEEELKAIKGKIVRIENEVEIEEPKVEEPKVEEKVEEAREAEEKVLEKKPKKKGGKKKKVE